MKYIQIDDIIKKCFFGKVFAMGLVGFHRGYCNNYSSGFLQHKNDDHIPIWNKNLVKKLPNDTKYNFSPDNQSILVVEKIKYGFLSVLYYINPFFYTDIFFYSIRRMEKRMRNIPFTENDWRY
jgi:hypothetical protein